jgi:class 3 adenylate cyclase
MRFMSDDQGEVTILFCDICDFDKVVSKLGKRVVNILDELFRVFDGFCATHSI